MFSLAGRGDAPAAFARTSRDGVPRNAVAASAVLVGVGVLRQRRSAGPGRADGAVPAPPSRNPEQRPERTAPRP